jgi:hypothetical protein
MPAADSAAGIARKWEGSVASGPSNQPYQTDLPLRMPDKHDVRFRYSGSKSKLRLFRVRRKGRFYRTFASSPPVLFSLSIKKSRRDPETQRWTQRNPVLFFSASSSVSQQPVPARRGLCGSLCLYLRHQKNRKRPKNKDRHPSHQRGPQINQFRTRRTRRHLICDEYAPHAQSR